MKRIDLDDLERKATAATPGPWESHGDRSRIPDYCSKFAQVTADDGCQQIADAFDNTPCPDEQCLANAEHIAANSPPVTLALIARIRELESAIRQRMAAPPTISDGDLIAILEKGAVLP